MILPLLALAACCGSAEPAAKVEKAKELKVLSWNIWHGGHSKEYPEVGCKGTLDILKASEADVIFMIETYGASDQVADHLGYYHRLLSSNLSIYSRYPITKTLTFADSVSTFNFGGVEIDVDGKKMRLFDLWIHYLPDTRDVPYGKGEEAILAWDDAGSRDDEMRSILSVIAPYMAEADSIPVIVAGDFNSHSHLDWTEATKDMYGHGGEVVGWSVSKMMAAAGFKDSFREINPDPVTNLGVTWMHPVSDNTSHRIDYIYYMGKALSAKASEIYNKDLGETLLINGKECFYASDHGLVLTTFDIK